MNTTSVWKLVKLDFGRSPAHFGELGIGIEETSERVKSDTLFSAWISIYARLFPEKIQTLFNHFPTENQPDLQAPFRLSSTYIYRDTYQYINGNKNKTKELKTIYYLPRPLAFPFNYPDDDLEFFKTYKKLNYLPLEIWSRWYQGEGFTDKDAKELKIRTKNNESHDDLNNSGAFDYKKAFKISQNPKVAIDRITSATNFYHTGLVQFETEDKSDNKTENKTTNKRSGLYFLIEFPKFSEKFDKELEDNLYAALNLLGEYGLGGERSSGAGRFKIAAWENLPKEWEGVVKDSDTNYHTLISLYWNSKLSESFPNECNYEIVERGGWISPSVSGRNYRRKFVRMFAEGSVFKIINKNTNTKNQLQGILADITPEELITKDGKYKFHPIYRSGISVSLPIKIKV
jgi:CRISPR-associated protein Csm4